MITIIIDDGNDHFYASWNRPFSEDLTDDILIIAKEKAPLYGPVKEIMTEQNMHRYFDIEFEKINYKSKHSNLTFETMIPTALAIQTN